MDKIASYSHRFVLFLVAGIGAWIALGGVVSWLDLAFAGLCVVANEVRVWLRLDRWPRVVFVIWLVIFLQLPTIYFVARLFPDFLSELPTEQLPVGSVLPIAIVAMALPFQIFAAYYASMPRAHHLVLVFALVESVLAAKTAKPEPLWLWLMLLVLVMGLALLFGAAQDLTNDAQKTISQGRKRQQRDDWINLRGKKVTYGGLALLHRGMLPWMLLLIPGLLFFSVVLFAIIPKPNAGKDQQSARRDSSSSLAQENRTRNPMFLDEDTGSGENPPAESGVRELQQEVQLGRFGELKLDTTPYADAIIRVRSGEIPASLQEGAYFRLDTYTNFDGKLWKNERTEETLLTSDWSSSRSLTLEVDEYRALTTDEIQRLFQLSELEMRFRTEHYADRRGLALAFPGAFVRLLQVNDAPSGETSPALQFQALAEQAKLVTTTGATQQVRSFEAHCFIPKEDLRYATNIGRATRSSPTSTHLRLPRGYQEFLIKWPERSRFVAFVNNPLRLAEEIEEWFVEGGGFEYSLSQRPMGEDAILDFLTDQKQRIGHCEYFASAMVVLLRSFGVESRLAVGFASGAPSMISKNEAIYQLNYSQAHAWVEVRVPGQGWAIYDPTTHIEHPDSNSAGLPAPPPSENFHDLDTSDENRSRVPEEAQGLPNSPKEALSLLLNSLSDALRAIASLRALPILLTLMLPLLALGVLFLWLRKRFKRQLSRRKGDGKSLLSEEQIAELAAHLATSQQALLRRFIEACERFEVRRLHSQTPREFVTRMNQVLSQELGFLQETVHAFYELCYGAPREDRTSALEQEISRDIERLDGIAKA